MFNQTTTNTLAMAMQKEAAAQQGYGNIQAGPATPRTIQNEVEILVKRLITTRDNLVALRTSLVGSLPQSPEGSIQPAPDCVLNSLSAANTLLSEIEGEMMAISARF